MLDERIEKLSLSLRLLTWGAQDMGSIYCKISLWGGCLCLVGVAEYLRAQQFSVAGCMLIQNGGSACKVFELTQ